ncbi:MAG: Maf family protein [Ginsengibacter sp.]
MQKIILASRSPRRRQILQLANVPFEVISMETDESYPAGMTPERIAMHIAANKASAVSHILSKESADLAALSLPILSADTIVVLDNEIIGKPLDKNDALKILQKLSGNKHLVITGVVILYNNTEIAFADITEVEFHKLTDLQMEYYIDNYKPFDKAGAYAIQEWIGVTGIKSITGDYYNVMGLPISRVLIELQKIKN